MGIACLLAIVHLVNGNVIMAIASQTALGAMMTLIAAMVLTSMAAGLVRLHSSPVTMAIVSVEVGIATTTMIAGTGRMSRVAAAVRMVNIGARMTHAWVT